MLLHTILKKLFKNKSIEEFTSTKLVDMIKSANEFSDEDSTLYILNRMIEDGYLDNVIHTTKYDMDKLENNVQDYVEITGFQPNYIRYVTKCLYYAIGIIKASMVTFDEDNNESYEYYDYEDGVNQFFHDMSDDEFEEFIFSKFEWDHQIEKRFGVDIYNMTVEPVNDFTGFKLIFLAKGKPKKEFVHIDYICYDVNGKMRTVGSFYVIASGKINRINSEFINFNRDLQTLGKIEFLIDD